MCDEEDDPMRRAKKPSLVPFVDIPRPVQARCCQFFIVSYRVLLEEACAAASTAGLSSNGLHFLCHLRIDGKKLGDAAGSGGGTGRGVDEERAGIA